MKGGVIPMHLISQLETFDIDPNHIITNKFAFNNKQQIDYVWIKEQLDYTNALTDRQKHIVYSYTIYGDKFINYHLRGKLTLKLIKDIVDECKKNKENPFKYQHLDKTGKIEIDDQYVENIVEYIVAFIEEFRDIIIYSPRLRKNIKVFRGLKDGHYIINSIQGGFMINSDFISTSIYLASASNFMNGDCCLLELYIDVDTPCLFTANLSRRRGEYEITLINKTVMKYMRCTKKYILDNAEYYHDLSVFFSPEKQDVSIIRMCEFKVSAL